MAYTTVQTVFWPGATGRKYKYEVHELTWHPSPDQLGNYIFARQVGNGWEAIDIGQGDLKKRKEAHMNEGCVLRKGATHYHCHLNHDEGARRAEEADLLAEHSEAYEPTGCNKR